MSSRQFRSDDTATEKWVYGFGDGHDGSSYSAPAVASCSGNDGSTSLTLGGASTFANGDLVLIHQTRGTGTGKWELNRISSGGGSTSITLSHALTGTYTDSGAYQAQIVEMKEYNSLTISGTTTATAWDQNTGGIIAFFNRGTLTISGTLDASGKGYLGGPTTSWTGSGRNYTGEGAVGTFTKQQAANGNGGGGGEMKAGRVGGGGGGANINNGSNGQATSEGGDNGYGGTAISSTELITFPFGGGGGCSGMTDEGDAGAAGGPGGGLILIISQIINVSGYIKSNGTAGTNNTGHIDRAGGGGGAGGCILIKAQQATLGTNITLSAGAGGASGDVGGDGGAGSVGHIHLDYRDSRSGTTTPTKTERQDLSLDYPPREEQSYTLLM